MNKLHELEFPKTLYEGEKKTVSKLYIDADEGHVALQYLESKGDIQKPRSNTIMPRLAYVYEGIDTEKDGRPKLINVLAECMKEQKAWRHSGKRCLHI